MVEERNKDPITQVINWHQAWKEEQGHVRTLSVQLEEAQRALDRGFLEREGLQKKVVSLEERVLQLQDLAIDEMTNLAPCALRDRQLEAYMEQYKRQLHGRDEKAPLPENRLIVLSIDLDQFSAINDKYGRVFGDHILRFAGRVITSRIRKCDVASRKGQRFSVIFVDCTRRGAIMKAREIVLRIARENFGESTGEQIQVTVTVGIADYDGKISREDLLRRADCAMKFGKDRGRYCTVMYAKEGGPHEVVESYVRNGKAKV